MKFALLVLALSGSPQYIVGNFNSMVECQRYPIPAESKRICLIYSDRKGCYQ